MGDGNILVGYIPQNTTLGTANGVNGKITIKAYLDKNKIAISDTYDGNETDLMGTTNEWVNGRVNLTTEEWNALQQNGISFQVKVEANEGLWVEETLYDIIERQTVMDNINSTFVNNTTPGIDFSNISSDTNGKGVYTFSSTANDAYPVMYYRGAVENNNVLFANKCWKMVRTTDTGGVKLIYNGENKGTEEAPNCDNTGEETLMTLNIDGTETNKFAFNVKNNSPAYNGYMYGAIYDTNIGAPANNVYFGSGYTYDNINNLYTLTDAKVGIDEFHHYTCNETTSNGTCLSIRYYFWGLEYFTLSDGKSIKDAIDEMQLNIINSNAKDKIERWYAENIDNTDFDNRIEDTIYCNDRSIYQLGGLNPNGGYAGNASSGAVLIYSKDALKFKPNFYCRRNDAFTLTNGRGNGMLNYPIALLIDDEAILAGGKKNTTNESYYLSIGTSYYLMSPRSFDRMSYMNRILSNGSIYSDNLVNNRGLRPVLSLKNGTTIVDNDADGTVSKPYVIK